MSEDGGLSFVLSAPSGAGKSSLAEELLRRMRDLQRTVSCTTRAPREGETDGEDYFFLAAEEFDRRIAGEEFLEWAVVHGERYGTLRREIERIHRGGADAVMVIDVQGAHAVRGALDEAVTIFVLPPSRQALIERLEGRDGTTPDASRSRRLAVAEHEIAEYVSYDYVVINDEFESAVTDLLGIVRAERSRTRYRSAAAQELLVEFRATATD